ncbi:MAG: ABC transporter ATP-binding protein, partial [Gammaproteobacteria bacterium]|nr:ABC transporter ATP-binding protein [Gammaproteobacteria bacterium]
MTTASVKRDYAMFDADLSGKALNLSLLRRLLRWLKPYRVTFALSGVLVLIASTLQVLLPVVVSIVVIDRIIQGNTDHQAPDFGMADIADWLSNTLGAHPLAAACILYAALQIGWAVTGHAHRMTLTQSVIKGLRDLRLDLFRHLETRPAAFYDRVAVGRVMTRVTNDVEALYDLLRGIGSLIGEFVPFLVALLIMLSIDPALTGILLLALPVMAAATIVFRRATRKLFRLTRQTVSALNQNMQENLAGLQVVQLSGREQRNLADYRGINQRNLGFETTTARWETLYGALNDSIAHIAIGVILYYGGGAVIQDHLTLG